MSINKSMMCVCVEGVFYCGELVHVHDTDYHSLSSYFSCSSTHILTSLCRVGVARLLWYGTTIYGMCVNVGGGGGGGGGR